MLPFFLLVVILVGIAVAGLSIGVIVKGKFPDTHVEHNEEMKKLGITCAKNDQALCQGRKDSTICRDCIER